MSANAIELREQGFKPALIVSILGTLGIIGVIVYFNFYMAIATFAYVTLLVGVLLRKNRRIHMQAMVTGISLDLALVLVLQIQRNAIATAVAMELGPLQQAHIAFSTLAVLGYVPLLVMGTLLWRGRGGKKLRRAHLSIGWLTFVLRSLGFICMFSLAASQS